MTGSAEQPKPGYRNGITAQDRRPVRLLILDRPKKLNAFTPEGYRELARQLTLAAADGGVNVVVLSGAGRAFCSGVDLDACVSAGEDLSEFRSSFEARLRLPFTRLATAPEAASSVLLTHLVGPQRAAELM